MTSRRHRGTATLAVLALLPALVLLCGCGAHAAYAPAMAKFALYHSKAAYCDAASIAKWTCAACAEYPSLQVNAVINSAWYITQGFVGVDADRIVVSFRGTQNIWNWFSNLDIFFTKYPNTACNDCFVHSGFLNAYTALKDQMWRSLRKLLVAHPGKPLLVTGHSLGGALALLAAADIASERYASGAAPHIDLYTFGSPRVGNAEFAQWVAALFCKGRHESYRITHKMDVVPQLPPYLFGFRHAPTEVWYNNDGGKSFQSCSDVSGGTCTSLKVREDSTCSASVSAISIDDHLQYLGTCLSCSCGFTRRTGVENVHNMSKIEWIIKQDHLLMKWCEARGLSDAECMTSSKRNETILQINASSS